MAENIFIKRGCIKGNICFVIGRMALWMVVCFFLLIMNSCREAPEAVKQKREEPSSITIESVTVPVFETSEEQLNYTRAWFADINEKRAALLAFIKLFPEQVRYCGLAALDLAYLELGGDYRLAREHDSFAAIKAYKGIIDEYPGLSEIQAKAHWYIGWIYADLIDDREKGIEYYRRVVSRFPEEEVTLLPPAPWVSIIYPDDASMSTALYNPPRNTWGALALVEIIRYAEDDEFAWSSFEKLWKEYRQNVATGFGLKLILKRRVHVERSLLMAREYMEKNFSNVHILSDIQQLIHEIESGESA